MTSKLMGLHQHELVETAKLFSSKGSKVNVVFDDGGARTDGNTIWLPASPPDVALSEKGQRFDRAMVDHEASHHDVTNMKEFTTGVSGGDRRLEGLVQAIEDCRVDKNAIIKHPGARKNLGTARDMAFEGSAELIEATKDARHFAGTGIINAWWEKHGGWPSLNRKRAFEALPPEMQDFCRKYAELADELSLKRTTKPTVELAEKALAELLAMGETPPEQEQEQEPGPRSRGRSRKATTKVSKSRSKGKTRLKGQTTTIRGMAMDQMAKLASMPGMTSRAPSSPKSTDE